MIRKKKKRATNSRGVNKWEFVTMEVNNNNNHNNNITNK